MSFAPVPPDSQLVDISFFARYSYSDWTSISLRLLVLPMNILAWRLSKSGIS